MKRIWFDVDGVLANFVATYLDLLYEVTGRTHREADVTCWDFSKCVADRLEDSEVWARIGRTPGIVAGLARYPGMLEVVDALRADGHTPRALTSPAWACDRWIPERITWLNIHGFWPKQIVFSSDKAAIFGDVLIEDSRENVQAWCAAHRGFDGVGVLVDRPWNQGALPDNAVRVSSPEAVLAAVRGAL